MNQVLTLMLLKDDTKAVEIVNALSDEYSRKIVLAIMSKSESIEELSKDLDIPISTCYRKVRHMLRFGIVRPFRTVIDENGKKYVSYATTFKNASVKFESGEMMVDVIFNNVSNKVENVALSNDLIERATVLQPTPPLVIKEILATSP